MDHLEYAANRGDTSAQEQLDNVPEYPEDVSYLIEWIYKLHGRSGIGMGGASPLSHLEIEAWARLMDIQDLEPHEVEALVFLDTAFHIEDEPETEDRSILPRPRWPTRKAPEER